MKKIRIITALAVVFSLFIMCIPVGMSAEEVITLKVGYIGYEGFISPDEDGKMYGYGVEYLEEIGKSAAIEYEYVHCTWEESLEMLRSREIDLVCSSKYTAERSEIYDYALRPFGVVQGVLYTASDNDDIYYEEFSALDGKRIGLLKSSLNIPLFDKYAKNNGFTYECKEYNSEKEMEEALLNGQVDAIATESIIVHQGLKRVGIYSRSDFYLMSYKDNSFMDRIDKAMANILSMNVNYASTLERKYFGVNDQVLSLTRKEEAFVESCGTITVAMPANKHPVSGVDKNGQLYGIAPDLFDKISEISGLEFYYVPVEDGRNPIDELIDNNFDIASTICNVDASVYREDIILSQPYYNSFLAAAVKTGDTPGSVPIIACKDTSCMIYGDVDGFFDEYNLMTFETNEECLQAVLDGTADYFVQNINVINYLLSKPQYEKLEISSTILQDEKNAAAFRIDADPCLVSVINKAISCIPQNTVNEITTLNTSARPYNFTLSDRLYVATPYVIVVSVCIAAGFVLSSVYSSHQKKRITELSECCKNLNNSLAQSDNARDAAEKFIERINTEIRSPVNVFNAMAIATANERHTDRGVHVYKALGDMNLILDDLNEISYHILAAKDGFELCSVISEIADSCSENNIDIRCSSKLGFNYVRGDETAFRKMLEALLNTASAHSREIDITAVGYVINSDLCCARLDISFEGGGEIDITAAKEYISKLSGSSKVISTKNEIIIRVTVPFNIDPEKTENIASDNNTIKALILDSDNNSAAFAGMILTKAGVEAECAASVAAAEAMAENNCYRICFIAQSDEYDRDKAVQAIRAKAGSRVEFAFIGGDSASDKCDYYARKKQLHNDVCGIIAKISEKDKAQIIPSGMAETYDLASRKVIVADDECSMSAVAELLKIADIKTVKAANGDEVVQLLQTSTRGEYDAVLLELDIAVSDGFETCEQIRGIPHPDAESIPVIAVSKFTDPKDICAAICAGMDGYICKPVDAVELFEVLSRKFSV